ncbi:hypothetical protein ACFL49_00510 [Candidatus Omnitrophota bacterium]
MERKKIFEVYGLSRLVLGLCQLVGLSAGFFLKEWIVTYPKGSVSIVFDADLIALVYLAVLVRAVFHIIVGIGVARLQPWTRFWLIGGWPLTFVIAFGLASALTGGWSEAGLVVTFARVIHWGKVGLLSLLVAFDWFFIIPAIQKMNQAAVKHGQKMKRLQAQHIVIVSVIVIFCLSIVLFMGRTIRKGFHPGFYKTKQGAVLVEKRLGARTQRQEGTPLLTPVEAPAPVSVSGAREGRPLEPKDVEARLATKQALPVLPKESLNSGSRHHFSTEDSAQGPAAATTEGKTWPVRAMVAVFGGGCCLLGFLFQLFEMIRNKSARNISVEGYSCFVAGFLCGCFYGLNVKNIAVTLICFLLACCAMSILWLRGKYDQD